MAATYLIGSATAAQDCHEIATSGTFWYGPDESGTGAALTVATTDSASVSGGLQKCFKAARAAGDATGTLYARAYRAFSSPAFTATDDIFDVFFWLKVGTDWTVLDGAGAEANAWYPDICRIACNDGAGGTTSLALKLYKYYNAPTDVSHDFRFRVTDTANNYEDAKVLGTNPAITPGAWHQIHWRTSGWQSIADPGVVSEVWIDGHPVTWEQGATDTTESTARVVSSLPKGIYFGHSYNSGGTTLNVTANIYIDDVVAVSSPDSEDEVDAFVGEMHSKVLPQSDGTVKVMVQTLTPCTGVLDIGTATGDYSEQVTGEAVEEHDDYVLWFDLGALAANDTYYYRIVLTDNDTGGTWTSTERTFVTDPGETAAHTALIFSGIQDNTYRGFSGGYAAANHSSVGLTIYNGDIGDHYTHAAEWATDYEAQRLCWGRNEMLTKPLDGRSLAVLQPSNHDFMLDNGLAFWQMHPGSEYWHLPYGYADYFFLSMNWGPEYAAGHADQIAWLESVLPKAQRLWKIVVFEYAMFGNHPHLPGDAETYEGYTGRRSMIDRAEMHDLFAAHKVNLVVSGDVAVYNRWASGGVMYVIGPPTNAINTTVYANVPDFEQGYPNPNYTDVPTDPALAPKWGSRRACLGKGGYLHLAVDKYYIDIRCYERKFGTVLDRFQLKPGARAAVPGRLAVG